MHFLSMNKPQQHHDVAYWRDVGLSTLGAVCILGALGHFLDWLKERRPVDGKVALGLAISYCLLLLFLPRRFNFVIYSLVTILAWGLLGAVVSQTLLGLPILVPCAVLVYFLLRWKGHLLK